MLEKDGIAYVQNCVGDLLAGMRNYDSQLLEVQSLLEQLAQAIDNLRGRPAPVRALVCDPPQTLPPVSAQMALANIGSDVQCFQMSSGASPPIAQPIAVRATGMAAQADDALAPTIVIGESVGDKRKHDQITESEPSLPEDIVGDERRAGN